MRKDACWLGLLRSEGGTLARHRQQHERTQSTLNVLLRADAKGLTGPLRWRLGCATLGISANYWVSMLIDTYPIAIVL